MTYFNEVYSTLGVLLSDSDIKGESSYHDLLPVVMDRLSKSNILVDSDGADVVFSLQRNGLIEKVMRCQLLFAKEMADTTILLLI